MKHSLEDLVWILLCLYSYLSLSENFVTGIVQSNRCIRLISKWSWVIIEFLVYGNALRMGYIVGKVLQLALLQ